MSKTMQGAFDMTYHHIDAPTVQDEEYGKEFHKRKLIIPSIGQDEAYRSPLLAYLANSEWVYSRKVDGEIEGIPKIHTGDTVIEHFHPEQTVTTVNLARDYLQHAVKVKESFHNVNVDLCEDGTLYIDDAETDEQLAKFIIR